MERLAIDGEVAKQKALVVSSNEIQFHYIE